MDTTPLLSPTAIYYGTIYNTLVILPPPFENDTLNALRWDAYRWIPHEVDDVVEIDGYKHWKLGFQHPLEYM